MSEKEGELKKRILDELENGARMQDSPLRCNNTAEVQGLLRVGIAPNIRAILDEAKKEYLQLKLFNDYKVAKQLVQIQMWFEKWFGEEKNNDAV